MVAVDEFREYVVVCGKSHVSVNSMHKFTLEEAESVRSNMENKLRDKLDSIPEGDIKSRQHLEWRLATLEIKKVVFN
jgi:hypothetical protein